MHSFLKNLKIMVSIIAAVSKNGVIGSYGRIPWNIPEDLAYFRKVTMGGVVIMGRNTYEEIGRPLPERFNIIVSQSKNFSGDNLRTVRSLEEAISLGEQYADENEIQSRIFLCGGQRIYSQGMKYAQRLYLTEIDADYNGDAFFPESDLDRFRLKSTIIGKTPGVKFCIYEFVSGK